MMVIASQRPNAAIDTLTENFGTDEWLSLLIDALNNDLNGDYTVKLSETILKLTKLPRFSSEKLGA